MGTSFEMRQENPRVDKGGGGLVILCFGNPIISIMYRFLLHPIIFGYK